MKSNYSVYFQFPICLLSYGRNFKDRLPLIAAYSIGRAGEVNWYEKDESETAAAKATILAKESLPFDFNRKAESHWWVMWGAHITQSEVISSIRTRDDYCSLDKFVEEFEEAHGADGLVRIRTSILFDAIAGKLKYRHFATLCAIYSILGNKPYARITREAIRMRTLGYRSKAIQEARMPLRMDGALPLSERQLRDAIDYLQIGRFFCKVHPKANSRRAFFSNRMTEDQLIEAVAKEEVHRRKGFQLKAIRKRIAEKVEKAIAAQMQQIS